MPIDSPRHSPEDREAPFFGAFDAVAVDDGGGWSGLSRGLFATRQVKRFADAVERAIPTPEVEIIKHRALGRKILRKRSPLATCAQNIHKPMNDLAHHYSALAAAAFAGRDQRFDEPPFLVSQIAGLT